MAATDSRRTSAREYTLPADGDGGGVGGRPGITVDTSPNGALGTAGAAATTPASDASSEINVYELLNEEQVAEVRCGVSIVPKLLHIVAH